MSPMSRDGSPPQRNVVRVDGRRSVLMSILKSGSASTLDIVDDVKALLPQLKETLPPSLQDRPARRPVDFRARRPSPAWSRKA